MLSEQQVIIIKLLEYYPQCFIGGADNIGSKQMQQICTSLRGTGIVLMEKNTLIRKAIKRHIERNSSLEKILLHTKKSVGSVFTHEDLVEVKDKLLENKVKAPAHCLL